MKMKAEIWIPIPGHEGYEVSSLGQVRSYWKQGRYPNIRDTPRLLSQYTTAHGYRMVGIGGKREYVHKLVMLAFVGPRPNGAVIRHLDNDGTNNETGNLSYGTMRQNWNDAVDNRLNKLPNRASDEVLFKIRQALIEKEGNLTGKCRAGWVKAYFSFGFSQVELAEIFCISSSYVNMIVHGKRFPKIQLNLTKRSIEFSAS